MMKNIKPFNLFEGSEYDRSLEKLKRYILDIFQELIDVGFSCRVTCGFYCNITLIKNTSFKYKHVADYFDSLDDYMLSIGYKKLNINAFDEYQWVGNDINISEINKIKAVYSI